MALGGFGDAGPRRGSGGRAGTEVPAGESLYAGETCRVTPEKERGAGAAFSPFALLAGPRSPLPSPWSAVPPPSILCLGVAPHPVGMVLAVITPQGGSFPAVLSIGAGSA